MPGQKWRLNLALQGGGAHGAFTWGVLDHLLEADAFEIGWISGTSAGALNAVALATGLAEGGRDGARARLRLVWETVANLGEPDFLRNNPILAGLTRSNAAHRIAQLFSPSEINPLGLDPLRRLIEQTIDFTVLRTVPGPELLIAATHIASGRARLFRRRELTAEALLASACLPMLQRAVEIDGQLYWDGGFSANPDLVTLGSEAQGSDTLIVQLAALVRESRPLSAREINGHMLHLVFNMPFVRHLEHIETVRRLADDPSWLRRTRSSPMERRLARHRFHLIEAGRFTGGLSVESRGQPEHELIRYLHQAGREQAGKWLERHRADVGVRDTAELSRRLTAYRSAGIS